MAGQVSIYLKIDDSQPVLGARNWGKRINACTLLLQGGSANLLWPVED
ncbi:hypothetical protein [Microcoleus sp. AR_TQ3_B6]